MGRSRLARFLPRRFLAVLFVGLLLPGWLSAEPASLIRMVTGSDYPPFADKAMPGQGIATELVRMVYRERNQPTKLTITPWNRALRDLKTGRADVAFPFVPSFERHREFLFSDPLFHVQSTMFRRHDDHAFPESLEALSDVRICRPTGYALIPQLRYRLQMDEIDWVRPQTMKSCFNMLRLDRVDMVPSNRRTGWYTIDHSGMDPSLFATWPVFEEETALYLVVSRDHPEARRVVREFNQTLRQVRETEAGRALINRYRSPH
ncbi:amino acid ABC transporter substrate-binding protein (PAAT family) [Tamilnaduibacter salinus]|uniref:Amino acid ABC transporter substrate-binding protein (PAAT family) n=1 Tax=Tamilnaduibacter salinus TaxID=1484056 RepID=A0A2U1CWP1_9GAMM|nr:transporter substrate-binding domain-containing protein [Tamilnaduibacter salinus]PVY76400.1 amino acid ABC transporter substrate-binding protein (PAAT family) [Tamilnaduibacter salinus]